MFAFLFPFYSLILHLLSSILLFYIYLLNVCVSVCVRVYKYTHARHLCGLEEVSFLLLP